MGLSALSSMINPPPPPLKPHKQLKPFWLKELGHLSREIFIGAYNAGEAISIANSVLNTNDVVVKDRFELDYETTYKITRTAIHNANFSGYYDASALKFKPHTFSETFKYPYVPFKPNPFNDDSI